MALGVNLKGAQMVGGENALGMGCVAARVNKFDIGDDDASLIRKIAAA